MAHSQLVLEQESIDRSGHFGVYCFGKDIQGWLAKEQTSGGDEDSGEGNLAAALYCQRSSADFARVSGVQEAEYGLLEAAPAEDHCVEVASRLSQEYVMHHVFHWPLVDANFQYHAEAPVLLAPYRTSLRISLGLLLWEAQSSVGMDYLDD